MSEQVDALRQAALALIPAAPAGAILAAMRALLADWELEAPVATAPAASTAPATAAVAPLQGAFEPAQAPTAPKADVGDLATWERVRQQVRETRQARGLTMRQLAEQLGLALSTLEAALQTRRPPSRAMRARLEAWLAAAPEVAAEAFPFRGTGTSRGHTAGRGATARNGAGAGTDRHEAA